MTPTTDRILRLLPAQPASSQELLDDACSLSAEVGAPLDLPRGLVRRVAMPLVAGFALSLFATASAPLQSLDSDGDGLADDIELALGTDPYDVDTDGDGAWDGTEVDLAEGTASPDPLNPDSDGDTLLDGDEIAIGTSPSMIDTDGDGLLDGFDAYPTVPAFSSGSVEDVTRIVAVLIELSDLSQYNGKNDNVNSGRRNNLAMRCTKAANAIAEQNFDAALAHLWSLYNKIDGGGPIKDWITPSDASAQMAEDVSMLIFLLDGGNPCTPEVQLTCNALGFEACAPGSADCGALLEPCTTEVALSCIDAGLTACTIGTGSPDCGVPEPCTPAAAQSCNDAGFYSCVVGSGSAECGGPIVIFDPCSEARKAQCESLGFDPCEPGSFACVA